jgi:CheY-like chemotaxis protein/anti-sigma regulatory factor (Ser/Thr protein kinase)
MFEVEAAEKGLDFEVSFDENLPDALEGDPFRLRQILMNLLVNAIKYTDSGKVLFRCKLKKNYKKKVQLRFDVEDTGIGIAPDEIDNIFNVFEQGKINQTGRSSGAGLGLGICQKLVQLLKGEITVKSKLQHGSTFMVELPFAKTDAEKLQRDERKFSIDDRNLEGKRILLADDDDHNLLLAQMILRNWGTTLQIAKDGSEALDLLAQEAFDVLLLDIHMPEKNGVDVVRTVRSGKEQPNYNTPALAVTANALQSDLARYLKAGFDDYLIKPYKEADLYNKLCNAIGIESVMIQNQNEHIALQTTEGDVTVEKFDISELEQTANGDQEFIRMMIRNFADNANALLMRLTAALDAKDYDGIGEAAHKSLSSFRFFKLRNIVGLLEELEETALRTRRFNRIPAMVGDLRASVQHLIKEIEEQYLQSQNNQKAE